MIIENGFKIQVVETAGEFHFVIKKLGIGFWPKTISDPFNNAETALSAGIWYARFVNHEFGGADNE